MRRRDHDPFGQPALASAIVSQDRMRDRRRRRVAARAVDHRLDPLAASTSSALANAGTESACVSIPRKSGPLIFWLLR